MLSFPVSTSKNFCVSVVTAYKSCLRHGSTLRERVDVFSFSSFAAVETKDNSHKRLLKSTKLRTNLCTDLEERDG